jgi:hypothetical protein
MKEIKLMKEFWASSNSPFRFQEQVDPKTGQKKYRMKGMMLPFNKISRNNVMYNRESIEDKHKELINRPVMYNHKVDGELLPLGHFTNSWCEDDGWYYEADIDPSEQKMIKKLERGDLRHVSIQLIGDKIVEKIDDDNRTYTEAYVADIIEGSIVPAPGFLDTTASFAEAFGHKEAIKFEGTVTDTETGESQEIEMEMQTKEEMEKEEGATNGDEARKGVEDVTTDTADGAIQPTQDLEDDEDKENEKLAEFVINTVGEDEIGKILIEK